jgi:xanthine/CO dehydrogenase XdhC/CoxF family maturation factor
MAKDQRELCILATVFKSNGNQSEILGGRLLLTSDGTIHSTLAHELLSKMIVQDCNQALHSGQSTTNQYVYGENTADVFIEVLHQPLPLLIFGATPDVQPLVRFAAALGWNVTVVDHRSAYAEQKDFPDADAVLRFSPEEYSQRLHLTPDTYAVVMIHQFAAEANALRFLLSSDIRYVGLLGPKSKRDLLLQHLAAEGFTPRADQISTLHSPVGLDIGAETAEEIAVSIIAEITALTNNRTGGFLKDRSGSIH